MSLETITVTVLEIRESALKVLHFGKTAWLPRSQIEKMKKEGDTAEITIPYWLYKDKFE